jgi:Domain of unknown function (DUF4388)
MTPAQATQAGIDLVIPEGLVGQAIVTRVMHLMRRETESSPVSSATGAAAAPLSVPEASPLPSASPRPEPTPASPPPVQPPPPPVTPAPPVAPTIVTPPSVAPTPVSPATVLPSPAAPAPSAPPPAASMPAAPVATRAAAPASKAAPVSPSLSELEAVGLNGAMRTFQGALGSLKLEDLTQAIATGSKTGRLLLVLGTGGGMVAFDSGRVVHAEVGNTTGETAFNTLVTASHRESGGKFCFIPSAPRDLANVPKTITRSVSELLLGAATAMAEER